MKARKWASNTYWYCTIACLALFWDMLIGIPYELQADTVDKKFCLINNRRVDCKKLHYPQSRFIPSDQYPTYPPWMIGYKQKRIADCYERLMAESRQESCKDRRQVACSPRSNSLIWWPCLHRETFNNRWNKLLNQVTRSSIITHHECLLSLPLRGIEKRKQTSTFYPHCLTASLDTHANRTHFWQASASRRTAIYVCLWYWLEARCDSSQRA